jgi:hypothetical protein
MDSMLQHLQRRYWYILFAPLLPSHILFFLEDAPAPMALHSFKTSVVNGEINVTAHTDFTLKKNLARQQILLDSGIYSLGPGVVIVGGGSGAFHTVESLREASPICLLPRIRFLMIRPLAWLYRFHHDPFKRDIYTY